MTPSRRRLKRIEINLLKHLLRFASAGFPVTVPEKFRPAFVPLWRLELIEIWYRQMRDSDAGRRSQFISLTVNGQRRIQTLLASQALSRASGTQGQSNAHDATPEPQQEEERPADSGRPDAGLPQRSEDQD